MAQKENRNESGKDDCSTEEGGREKKPELNTTFADHFEPSERESALYQLWEKSGAFSFDAPVSEESGSSTKDPFVICMPPPNANGELHLGHSYGYSIMDTLGRYHRAQARPVLLLPGKDHAGIQTQVVFENRLRATGRDLSTSTREQLYDECYAFCMDRAQYMRAQEKQLGLSADWEREFFTLDPRLSNVVFETFVRLWDDGLIYRGKRIVNWSVLSGTAISDVEVDRKEVEGTLTYIRYPFASPVTAPKFKEIDLPEGSQLLSAGGGLWVVVGRQEITAATVLRQGEGVDSSLICVEAAKLSKDSAVKKVLSELSVPDEALQVAQALSQCVAAGGGFIATLVAQFDPSEGLVTATTRPETMLGDTALAVHPKDPRYAHVVGAAVVVPLIEREVKVIADNRVEIAFGAGVVKVTPAHDFLDFDIGETHGLPVIQVIGTDGRMTEEAGAYKGLEARECRKRVVADLEAKGLVEKIEKIVHKVPIAERSKDIIEPLISEQWFVAVDDKKHSLKGRALELLQSGKIDIHPPHFRKEFEHWLKNLRDWNISRQLWWGHRLPVWYRDQAGEMETKVSIEVPSGDGWRQETDTFDTWFSSGQWAFTTLAACGELDMQTGKAAKGAFPSECMVMGRDILFFWACRMLLLTAYRMDEVPWKSIYFTGLIRDEHGQKMSKSKGNGIEPGEIIKKFGSDALRVGLLFGTTPGNDVNMGEGKISGYSKFINKLWNAAKLLQMRTLGDCQSACPPPAQIRSDAAVWIVAEVCRVRAHVRHLMDTYQLGQALSELYGFTWDTYCDWYLEVVKVLTKESASPDTAALAELRWAAQYSFGSLLEMLHPFLPFLTEEIYQQLPGLGTAPTLCQAAWRPDPKQVSFESASGQRSTDAMVRVIEVVKAIRSSKVSLGGLGSGIRVALNTDPLSEEGERLVQELGRVQLVKPAEISADRAVAQVFARGVILFDHPDRAGFATKLSKEATSLEENIERLEKRLASDFAARAKPEVVAVEREKLQVAKQTLSRLSEELKALAR